MATQITEQTTGWQVVATITGTTFCETKEAIDDYFRRYPYAGYGSLVTKQIQKRSETDFVAKVTRSRSAG